MSKRAIITAQFNQLSEDDEYSNTIPTLINKINTDLREYALDRDISIAGPVVGEEWDDGEQPQQIVQLSDIQTDVGDDSSKYVAGWCASLPDDFDGEFSLSRMGGSQLKVWRLSSLEGVFAMNLYLLDDEAAEVVFQAWEAGEMSEGNETDPDDEDFNFDYEEIAGLFDFLIEKNLK